MKLNDCGRLVALVAAVTLSNTACAREGSMELVVGKGVAVCEAYAAAATKWDTHALSCIGDLPLDGRGISRVSGPVFKTEFSMDEADPTLGLRSRAGAFVRSYDVSIANYYYRDKLAEWRGSNEQLEVAGQGLVNRTSGYFHDPIIRILQVDLDNDGKTDDVYFYPHCAAGVSDESTVTMSSPLLLTPDRTAVDAERTLRLLRTPLHFGADRGPHQGADGSWVVNADIYSNSAFGFFKFRGKTFFDFWWDAGTTQVPERDRGILRVYRPQQERTEAVCAFRINPSAKGNN
jgi:hypothetical protein